MAILLALVILSIYLFRSTTPQQESSGLGRWLPLPALGMCHFFTLMVLMLKMITLWPCWCRSASAYITVAAFLLGAVCSGTAGYVGMWVSVRANVRVSSAARRSAREALQVFSFFFFCYFQLTALKKPRFLSSLEVVFADSCSCWWFVCLGRCWYGCNWCCYPLCHILCLVGGGFTRFNEGYWLWVPSFLLIKLLVLEFVPRQTGQLEV